MSTATRAISVAALSLMLGCGETKAPGDAVDDDGDGYSEDEGDCDDGRADVFPGADEVCDGADQDCDGVTDEDPTGVETLYRDGDLDGWGDEERPLEDCDPPEGYIATPGDCDDRDAADYPDAPETCDGEDDDCDGERDEAGAVDEPTWYLDADDDGYGVETDTLVQCDAPRGYAAEAGDCAPEDPAVHPDADESDCAEERSCDTVLGRDDDLDGVTTCAGDCDDADAGAAPGLEEVCQDGADNDCDGTSNDCGPSGDHGVDEAVAWVYGELGDGLPGALVAPGDLDGDGLGDWVVLSDRAGEGADGLAWVWSGAPSGEVAVEDAPRAYAGADALALPHLAAAGPGDLDLDGTPDLLLAQPDPADADAAGGYVSLFLSDRGDEIDEGDYAFYAETAGDRLGLGMAGAGDVDEDGEGELWLGAPGGDLIWLVGEALGGGGGAGGRTRPVAETGSSVAAEAAGDGPGAALVSADLDGDGALEAIVGAPSASPGGLSGAGAVYVLGPALAGGSLADADAAAGVDAGAGLGGALAAGDVDGDGYADVLAGQSQAAWLFAGPIVGRIGTADAVASLAGDGADGAGASVALGDVDGDGRLDPLVGAPTAAMAWLFLGPVSGAATPDARWLAGDAAGLLGAAVAVADLDADGHAELLLGAPAEAEGAGGVYLIAGAGW